MSEAIRETMRRIPPVTEVQPDNTPGCIVLATPVRLNRANRTVTFTTASGDWTAEYATSLVGLAALQMLNQPALVTMTVRGRVLDINAKGEVR